MSIFAGVYYMRLWFGHAYQAHFVSDFLSLVNDREIFGEDATRMTLGFFKIFLIRNMHVSIVYSPSSENFPCYISDEK